MLFIEDIYNLILQLIGVDDCINLAKVSKSNNNFITQTNVYNEYKNFYNEMHKRILKLENNTNILNSTMAAHKYALAIECNSEKLMSKYRINRSSHTQELLINVAIKTDNLELLDKILYEHGVGFRQCNLIAAYRYKLINIITRIGIDISIMDCPGSEHFLKFIYENKLHYHYDPNKLLRNIDLCFRNECYRWILNRIYYYDIIANIIIDLNLDYNLIGVLNYEKELLDKRDVDKLTKYMKYHIPKQFRK